MARLSETAWQTLAATHRVRLEPFIGAHLERRARGEKHPVWDFLFEYYSFRPSHLMRWSPGLGVTLETAEPGQFPVREWSETPGGVTLDIAKFPMHRAGALHETVQLLEATQGRKAAYGCYGMHEWAMVYRVHEMRHAVPLRLAPAEIERTVDSLGVRCSHYDAFRFFTEAAQPLNVLQPQADTRITHEQPGCIHAAMDLYKFAYKFAAWIPSEILADTFELARDARAIDMRASPYDFAALGFAPILLETAEGRSEYQTEQRAIAERAMPARARLIAAYRGIMEAVG